MERVRDHISFVIWFVGLSYVALWPTTAGDGGDAITLSPGLRLLGMLAAFWVAIRIIWLLSRRALRMLMPRLALQKRWRAVRDRLGALRRRRVEDAPPRWVPKRREFGLREPP